MRLFGLVLCLSLISTCYSEYQPTWESLDSRPLPSWFDDAKFGIFIHWGVYSVPSWAPVGTYAEWYWHDMMTSGSATQKFHNQTYGTDFKYPEFADQFKAELFDADVWAELFYRSGAQYVVPTSKHHEGFTLWPSSASWNWNSVDIGPKRDLIGEILTAVRKKGMHAGVYFSIYEWFNPLYTGSDPSLYVDQVLVPQWHDLINSYQPEVLWCDGAWDHDSTFWKSLDFLAWLYNESPVKDTIVVNDRFGSDTPNVHGGFYTPEYSSTVYLNHKWEENSGIDIHSYGFNRNTPADSYLTADYLINLLIRCVANGGNLLLDIGPSHDGSIPVVMQERLLSIGSWLSVNGEAIYKTRVWRVQQENEIDNTTLRYTMSAADSTVVYAILLQWPDDNVAVLPSPIATLKTQVTLLGNTGSLTWTNATNEGGLRVTLPSFNPTKLPCSTAWVLRLQNVN